MEPLALASWRQLPSLHPLWKLLVPHLKGVMAINTLGRARLITAGGVVDQTLSIGGGGKGAPSVDIARTPNFLNEYLRPKNSTYRTPF